MARTAKAAGGLWNDNGTWVEGSPPTATDSTTIPGNCPIVIPTGYVATTARCTLGSSDNSGGLFANLTISGELSIANGETLRVGGTVANRDAQLFLNPGGKITAPSGVYLNSCQVISYATKASPFVWTGGQIATLATGPKQDLQFNNVSFQTTGTFTLNLENTLGTFTSNCIVYGCTFTGTSTMAIGTTSTPNSTPISVTYSDFRDLIGGKTITFRRITGGSALYEFKYNTGYQTTPAVSIRCYTSTGFVIKYNALYNFDLTQDAGGGAIDCQWNVFASSVDTPNIWGMTDAANGNTFLHNYLLSVGNNMRGLIPVTNSTGGTGTNEVGYNVFEGPSDATHDKGDLIVARGDAIPIYGHHNLIIGAGEIAVGARVGAWATQLNLRYNSIVGNGPRAIGNTGIGHVFVPEGTPTTGQVNLIGNLVVGVDKLADTTIGGSSSGTQTIASADYGNFYKLATPYDAGANPAVTAGNTGKTLNGAHEKTVDPKHFDLRRNLAFWNFIFGSGVNTDAAAISHLTSTMNGYRGTPNFDQNGTKVDWTPETPITYVREGYAPTVLTLRGAGDPADGSPDVGAMNVRAPAGFF